ncbi:MAG: hypothetical protein ACLVB2_02990 [Clostridium fessum]
MESWEYALEYEACRGGQSREAVYRQMEQILSVMEQAVETGLAGTNIRPYSGRAGQQGGSNDRQDA